MKGKKDLSLIIYSIELADNYHTRFWGEFLRKLSICLYVKQLNYIWIWQADQNIPRWAMQGKRFIGLKAEMKKKQGKSYNLGWKRILRLKLKNEQVFGSKFPQ